MEKTDIYRTPFLKKLLVLLICGIIGAVIIFILLSIFAGVIIETGSYVSLFRVAVYISAFAGGFISGFLAAKNTGGRGFIIGAMASFFCIFLVWVITLIPGHESNNGLIPAALCIAGGVVGGIIGANTLKK